MPTLIDTPSNLDPISSPIAGILNPITVAREFVDATQAAQSGKTGQIIESNHILMTHEFAVVISDPNGNLGSTIVNAVAGVNLQSNLPTLMRFLSGGFSDVALPQIAEEYVQLRPVNRQLPHYLPYRGQADGVTLTRGLTFLGSPLYTWIDQYIHHYAAVPQNVYIYQMMRSVGGIPIPVNAWTLFNAQPVQVRVGPALKGIGAQLAVEEIALNFDDIKFDSNLVSEIQSLISNF